MTKDSFVRKISEKTGLSQVETSGVLDAIGMEVLETVKRKDQVKIPHLGTFRHKQTSGRVVKSNLTKGEEVLVPAYKTIKFTVAKDAKSYMNQ